MKLVLAVDGWAVTLLQRGGDRTADWAGPQSVQAPVPNVTVHPSTASVPIAVLMNNGPLLCSFNVPING